MGFPIKLWSQVVRLPKRRFKVKLEPIVIFLSDIIGGNHGFQPVCQTWMPPFWVEDHKKYVMLLCSLRAKQLFFYTLSS